MKTATETVDCPKCDGRGVIGAFSHIDNGRCFCCAGNKTIEINRAEMIAQVPSESRRKAEWVLASTPDSYRNLSYGKLLDIRNFVHGGWGLQEAYPTLRDHFFEVGNWAFCEAQDRKLAEFSYGN